MHFICILLHCASHSFRIANVAATCLFICLWFYLLFIWSSFVANLNSCWQLCRYLSVSHTRQIIYFLFFVVFNLGRALLLAELTSRTLHPKERLLGDRFGIKYLHKNTFRARGLWFIYRFKLRKHSNNNRKKICSMNLSAQITIAATLRPRTPPISWVNKQRQARSRT